MNAKYVLKNTAERERLSAITAKLTEAELRQPMANGWSVATKLVHLAFWDLYYLALIAQWERDGYSPSPVDVDATNEAVRRLSEAIPSEGVVELVQAAARAIDARIEQLSPEVEAAIQASGRTRILRRALHRREHLDQIEQALHQA